MLSNYSACRLQENLTIPAVIAERDLDVEKHLQMMSNVTKTMAEKIDSGINRPAKGTR